MNDALIVQLIIFGTVAFIGLLALLISINQKKEAPR